MRDRHVSWGNFEENFIGPAKPAIRPVQGDPAVEIFFLPDPPRLGMRISSADGGVDTPFEYIEIQEEIRRGERFLSVSSGVGELFETMYAFLVRVSDLVQLDGMSAAAGIVRAAEDFRRLFASAETLTKEKACGLWGELHLLLLGIQSSGHGRLNEWTGPKKEDHDFRGDGWELEVKTTTLSDRKHLISGLNQLSPSPGKTLYIASIQIGETGSTAAKSVSDLALAILDELEGAPSAADEFRSLVARFGFPFAHAREAKIKYQLRSEVLFFAVDEALPRMTKKILEDALGTNRSNRIDEVSYRISLEGLEPVRDLPFRFAALTGSE